VKLVWQRFQAVMSVICIVVYAASTFYALLLIYGAVNEHRDLSGHEYAELRDFAVSAGVLGWKTPGFREDIRDAVSQSRTLQAVIITGPGDYSITVEKAPGIIKWTGSYPHFSSGFYMLKRLEPAALVIDGQRNIVMSALATYIDFFNLLFILRKALLAILIAVVISFSLLIADIILKKPDASLQTEVEPQAEVRKAERFYPEDTPAAADEKAAEKDTGIDIKSERAEDERVETYETEPEPPLPDYETDTFGEFDDEPAFAETLAPELESADENDKELSLITAAWSEEDAPYKLLIDTAKKYFKQGSRIFEKNVPGIYVIAGDTTIDEAFEAAKHLHREAVSKLPDGKKSALTIGISSRAGRTMHAERLIGEAERALGKAAEDAASPIVAFKVDLQKYKEFLARNAPA
jgi:hypothetical protein